MNIGSVLDEVLSEGKNIDLQAYQLYVDLNDLLLKKRKNKVPKIDDVEYVISTFHTLYYKDLSNKMITKIKSLFKQDFIKKTNYDVALGGLDDFILHISNEQDSQKDQ